MSLPDNYIKMCLEAAEIQEQWNFKANCHVWLGILEIDGYLTFETGQAMTVRKQQEQEQLEIYWLPSIEDLVEIIVTECNIVHRLMLGNFSAYLLGYYDESDMALLPSITMTEIFLCFTMKKLYDKTWNGETWESDKS